MEEAGGDFTYTAVRGPELGEWLDELGRLRIAVFREYPYLYDGDLDYERKYLERYQNSPRGLVVLLKVKGSLVGATTCLPMADETPEFQAPFLRAGVDLDQVFYFGESVILPGYRGRGAGRAFFRWREEHAREAGPFRYTTFCAVDRAADHPSRPPGYRSLEEFWSGLGYRRCPELRSEFSWKEIGELEPSVKTLTFWLKEWA